MPILPAVIDPLVLLVMPPEKVEMVVLIAAPEGAAAPPTKMPSSPTEIVPELLMPPAKVENVTNPLEFA